MVIYVLLIVDMVDGKMTQHYNVKIAIIHVKIVKTLQQNVLDVLMDFIIMLLNLDVLLIVMMGGSLLDLQQMNVNNVMQIV